MDKNNLIGIIITCGFVVMLFLSFPSPESDGISIEKCMQDCEKRGLAYYGFDRGYDVVYGCGNCVVTKDFPYSPRQEQICKCNGLQTLGSGTFINYTEPACYCEDQNGDLVEIWGGDVKIN